MFKNQSKTCYWLWKSQDSFTYLFIIEVKTEKRNVRSLNNSTPLIRFFADLDESLYKQNLKG